MMAGISVLCSVSASKTCLAQKRWNLGNLGFNEGMNGICIICPAHLKSQESNTKETKSQGSRASLEGAEPGGREQGKDLRKGRVLDPTTNAPAQVRHMKFLLGGVVTGGRKSYLQNTY